jgi:hypothetical protein
MGFWGKINNPDFNVAEFRNIKNQSSSNGFEGLWCHHFFLFCNDTMKIVEVTVGERK